MTEKEYRSLKDRQSFSAVKQFATDRVKFYKRYILGDKSLDEEMSTAMKLGTVVDCKKFSPDEFDDYIKVATCSEPSGQMGDFTRELVKVTKQSLDEEYKVTREMKDMMEEAFKNVKYNRKGEEIAFKKKDFAWLVNAFTGSDTELFYKTCRSEFGKVVVDLNLMDAAEKTADELEACEWTKPIWNIENKGDIEVIDQLPLLYNVEIGLAPNIKQIPFKGKPDRVIINHSEEEYKDGLLVLPPKSITPFDLKVTYTGEDFNYQYWKMKYYLQVASYFLGLNNYKTEVRPELKDYEIPGIEFIVASSTLTSNPLLFSTKQININEGLMGFVDKYGKRYKGLYELIGDIEWHKENGLWRNSKEVYENKGKMVIKPFEESEEE